MPRKSNVQKLSEAHGRSMLKCPIFELWAYKHLRCRDRVDDYRKAFDLVHSVNGADSQQEEAE